MSARLKRWVLSPDWNCCRLMVGERKCSDKEFHVLGVTRPNLPNSVLVDGMRRSPRCAERSLTLPPTSVSEVQMPTKYEGQVPRTQSKASTATLNSIRCSIGSQWSVSYMTSYWRSIVNMALSLVVSEIFNVEKYRDHEITVRGQSRSLKLVPFDTLDMISY